MMGNAFAWIQRHSVVSGLILLAVLLTPLAGLEPVQTGWDRVYHTAVIEGYAVVDETCRLVDFATTLKAGHPRHMANLEEQLWIFLEEEHAPDEVFILPMHPNPGLSNDLDQVDLQQPTEVQTVSCHLATGKYVIRATWGRSLLSYLGQPIWSIRSEFV